MGHNNMKSFLFIVILFCSLHFHKSSAIRASKSPFFKSKTTPFSAPNNNINTPQPPATDDNNYATTISDPNSQTVQIKGLLSIAKQHLYDLGYMTDSTYPFSDILDSETITAISTYQKNFNLYVTGQLDGPTANKMLLPRCVVPDMNVNYVLNSQTKVSWPQGIRWFPNGASTNHLTYGFLPESKVTPNFQSVFANAFNRWSEAIAELNLPKLIFTETDYNTADIKIGFYYLDNNYVTTVGGTIIRYDNGNGNGNRIVGDIRLDASKYWVLPGYIGTWSWVDGNYHLETVVMHQIGHILGLSHSSDVESIMHPSLTTTNEVKVEVTADDKNNILDVFKKVSSTNTSPSTSTNTSPSTSSGTTVYGSSSGHYLTPFWLCALLLTNFSLGFILLLY